MSVVFDTHELTQLDRDILTLAKETMPRETKKFMRREGGRLRTATKATARSSVKRKTGNYLKSIKGSKAWQNAQGDYAVKVYSSRSGQSNGDKGYHAHLLEHGHDIVTHTKRNTGKRARAFKIFERASANFNGQFTADAQKFVDDLIEKGLS